MPVNDCCVWPKNAASDWKSVCFHSRNGWSWHSAQSSRTPKNARETRAASAFSSGAFFWSGLMVTVMKFVAGWSVHRPLLAIRSRTIAS